MTKTLATLLACAALAATACGDGSGGDAETGGGPISYSRTGGIAGVAAELTIDEDGAATLTTEGPKPRTETFRVPADQLDAITSGIEATGMAQLDAGISEGCADCFVYELEYGGQTATADSVTAPGEFAEATTPLERLLNGGV